MDIILAKQMGNFLYGHSRKKDVSLYESIVEPYANGIIVTLYS